MWTVSLTCPILFCVGSSSYTPVLFPVGISLTHPVLFHVGIVSYTPCAVLCVEFVLHTPCCFMWGVCLRHPLLFYVGSLYFMWGDSYMPHAVVLCEEFLLHAPCCSIWGVSLTRCVLFYVGSFSYTPLAVLCGEFLFHAPCCFIREFLLHDPCCFMWGVSHFSGRFVIRLTNQRKNKVCQAKSAYRASDEASVMPVWLVCLDSCQILCIQQELWLLCWHLPWTDTACLDLPQYRWTWPVSLHTSLWISFHIICFVFFLCQLCIHITWTYSNNSSIDCGIMFPYTPWSCWKW